MRPYLFVLAIILSIPGTEFADGATAPENNPPAAAGTVHFHDFDIPLSDFSSPELQAEYVRGRAAQSANDSRSLQALPGRDAPRTEWDQYYAKMDRMLETPLAWDLEHYPVDI